MLQSLIWAFTAHDLASDTPPGSSPAAPSHVSKPGEFSSLSNIPGVLIWPLLAGPGQTPLSTSPDPSAIADTSETGPSKRDGYVQLRAEYKRLKIDLADMWRDYHMVGDWLGAAEEKLVTASLATFLSYYE